MRILEPFLATPVLPATVLVLIVVLWGCIGSIGLVDWHVDSDISMPEATGSLSGLSLKWLNLRYVPLILWLGVFSVAWWGISLALWLAFDDSVENPGGVLVGFWILRNLVVSIGITKLVTQPMIGWFESEQEYNSDLLIGATCEISSHSATPKSGQGRFPTDAAPLLLNVRTDGEELPKGTVVTILGYDPQKRIYIVKRATSEELQ